MTPRFLLAGLVILLAAPAAGAAPLSGDAYRRLETDVARHHIAPRYARLAEAAGALDDAATAFCAGSRDSSLDPVRDAFRGALDSWMAVQHIQFGPIEADNRAFRLHFWPERKNAVGRHLGRLLAARDAAALAPGRFADGSVAVQGFPALERLLFDAEAEARYRDAEAGAFRCAVSRAITANVRGIADDLAREWSARTAQAGAPGADAAEIARQLVGSLQYGLRLVSDLKLGKPLGPAVGQHRPKRAETWRSGRALANVQTNLRALRALYRGDGGRGIEGVIRDDVGDAETADALARAFDTVVADAEAAVPPLAEALADPSRRIKLDSLKGRIDGLNALVGVRLAPALGVVAGFNSLDGD